MNGVTAKKRWLLQWKIVIFQQSLSHSTYELTLTCDNLWCYMAKHFSSPYDLSSSPLSLPLLHDQGQDVMSGPGDLSVNQKEYKM